MTSPTDGCRARRRGGITVGLLGGLLANAGGFLLVPLYLAVLKLPIKTALACSLAVASVLAVPGTIVHAALGHIDWAVTLVFGVGVDPAVGAWARQQRVAHQRQTLGAHLRPHARPAGDHPPGGGGRLRRPIPRHTQPLSRGAQAHRRREKGASWGSR